MRDANRISEVLSTIEKAWVRVPDLRFMQLIHLIQAYHGTDMFYVEDESLMEFVNELIEEGKLNGI